MRWTIVSLCVFTAACGGQNLSSPTSPTGVTRSPNVILGAAGVSQTQALGGTELPFQGSFTRETHAVFEPPITLVITGTETGTASHLGRFTATSEDRVNTTNNTATGTLNITAANGDQLFTRTAGAETGFIPPNISMVTATATVLGGTGRFERATGTFTIEYTDTIDFATGSATGSGTFEGHINLNR